MKNPLPRIQSLTVVASRARLDGATDLLVSMTLAGEDRPETRWLAYREVDPGRAVTMSSRDGEPDVTVARGRQRKATVKALAGACPDCLKSNRREAESVLWDLQSSDLEQRRREAARKRQWTVKERIVLGGDVVLRLHGTPLPSGMAGPSNHCLVRVVSGYASGCYLVDTTAREIKGAEDFATWTLHPSCREGAVVPRRVVPEGLGRLNGGFSLEADARVAFAHQAGRTPAAPARSAFRFVERHPLHEGTAFLVSAGGTWACVTTRRPYPDFSGVRLLPEAHLHSERTPFEGEGAIGRLLRRTGKRSDLTEQTARADLAKALASDLRERIFVEGLHRTLAIREVVALADGRYALQAVCSWPPASIAPADAPRPRRLAMIVGDRQLWDLRNEGWCELFTSDVAPTTLQKVIDAGLEALKGESLRGEVVETLKRAEGVSEERFRTAWDDLLAGGVTARRTLEDWEPEPAAYPSHWKHRSVGSDGNPRDDIGPAENRSRPPMTSGAADKNRRMEIVPAGNRDFRPSNSIADDENHRDETSEIQQTASPAARSVGVGTESSPVHFSCVTQEDAKRSRGRPRVHATDADRKKAWRARKAAETSATPAPANKRGRPRLHADDAARKRAHAERVRASGKRRLSFDVPDDMVDEIRELVSRALGRKQGPSSDGGDGK